MELIGVIIAAVLYFIPAIIAFCRDHKSKLAILVVNMIFGWTLLGWLWAFIWCLCGSSKPQIVIIREEK